VPERWRSPAARDLAKAIRKAGGTVERTGVGKMKVTGPAGTATIAYLPAPGAPVVGLSKLPRLLDVYTRRLQAQEQITVQVTDALDKHLRTIGSACVLRAVHGCMAHRGVRKPGVMVTSSMTGTFRDNPATRAELLTLANG
jgi:GTP cyclohydrolase I